MPSLGKVEKKKRVNLTVAQNPKLIRKIEGGASVNRVCQEYGKKKSEIFVRQNLNLPNML